ncbi:MAG: cobalt-precorrin-5B (C(1))-methyltransferase CbiD [Methanobacteriaceae archaeon]|jgi:cobalt-precorrin-5B (C1)-methyltransferase|nr:cobalt-precorrin-5B (C(1))-methyltransferase CbiD [Candidatus Methanorudis spinitermitis]
MNLNNQKTSIYYGLTTGSIATAASLAALKSILYDENLNFVEIFTPFDKINVDIHSFDKINENKGRAIAIKYPYNDPDVTVNVKIVATVELMEKDLYLKENSKENTSEDIIIIGGEGVGKVTKSGLQVPPGKSAINPAPAGMIKENLANHLPTGKIAKVEISVPEGEKIAKKTMNNRLGIIGGISILGTTGIARPMSSKAYKESLLCQIDVAIGEGYRNDSLVFVPGNIGEKLALEKLNVEKDQIIQMGNFVGFMFEEAKKRGINKLTLFGHIGKLVKLAGGIFNTKHSIADGRREIIAAHSALCGASRQTVQKIFKSKTTEDMLAILKDNNLDLDVFNSISLAIKKNSLESFDIDIDIILMDMKGNQLNF